MLDAMRYLIAAKTQYNLLAISNSVLVLIVPTFDTKVTEYLCSGWVFFSSDKFQLFN